MKNKIKLIIDIRPITDDKQVYHYFYRIRNKINGKEYYGIHSTKNLNDGYAGSGKLLRKSILKHGLDNFYMQILKFFESRELCSDFEKEIVSPDYLKSFKDRTYNLVGGGDNGHFISDEIKQKISQSEKGKKVCKTTRIKLRDAALGRVPWNKNLLGIHNPHTGRKRTVKTRQNIAKALQKYYATHDSVFKGKKRSKEFCESVSAGKTGIKFTNKHKEHLSQSHLGLQHTDATKEKIRKSACESPRGYAIPKAVLCIELEMVFESAKIAWLSLKNKYNLPNYQNFCKKIRNNIKIDGISFKYIGD